MYKEHPHERKGDSQSGAKTVFFRSDLHLLFSNNRLLDLLGQDFSPENVRLLWVESSLDSPLHSHLNLLGHNFASRELRPLEVLAFKTLKTSLILKWSVVICKKMSSTKIVQRELHVRYYLKIKIFFKTFKNKLLFINILKSLIKSQCKFRLVVHRNIENCHEMFKRILYICQLSKHTKERNTRKLLNKSW